MDNDKRKSFRLLEKLNNLVIHDGYMFKIYDDEDFERFLKVVEQKNTGNLWGIVRSSELRDWTSVVDYLELEIKRVERERL